MQLTVTGNSIVIDVATNGAQNFCFAQGSYVCNRIPAGPNDLYIECSGTPFQWSRAQ